MRILAVGNDIIMQETLVQIALEAPCEEALAALTTTSALKLLADRRRAPFDMIVTDIDAPSARVIDFIAATRSTKGYADTPILGMTAALNEDLLDDLFAAGMTDFLRKPSTPQALFERFAQLIATERVRRLERQIQEDLPLHAPFKVSGVQGCIDLPALDHYAGSLTRSALFHAHAVGFAIRDIDDCHAANSSQKFRDVISEIAAVLSDELRTHRALFAYAGNGVFVSIIEKAPHLQTERLMHRVNTRLAHRKHILADTKISTGSATRMTWRSGRAVTDALRQGQLRAVQARQTHKALQKRFWFTERSA